MTLFEKIERLCCENDISISKLSRMVDLSETTIRKWCYSVRSPRLYALKKIADYFGVTVDSLLPDDGECTAKVIGG